MWRDRGEKFIYTPTPILSPHEGGGRGRYIFFPLSFHSLTQISISPPSINRYITPPTPTFMPHDDPKIYISTKPTQIYAWGWEWRWVEIQFFPLCLSLTPPNLSVGVRGYSNISSTCEVVGGWRYMGKLYNLFPIYLSFLVYIFALC